MRTPAKFADFYESYIKSVVTSNLPSIESLEKSLKAEELAYKYVLHMFKFLEDNQVEYYNGVYLRERDLYARSHDKKLEEIKTLIEKVKKIDVRKDYPGSVAYAELKKMRTIRDISIDADGRLVLTTNNLVY